jgi:hypothetical protein
VTSKNQLNPLLSFMTFVGDEIKDKFEGRFYRFNLSLVTCHLSLFYDMSDEIVFVCFGN